jgi:hypothetical protein
MAENKIILQGLTRAVRADKAKDLRLVNMEADVVDGPQAAKLHGVVFSLLLLIIMLFAREGLLGKKEIWQTGRRSGGSSRAKSMIISSSREKTTILRPG